MTTMYEFYPRGIGNNSVPCFVCGHGTSWGSETKPAVELELDEKGYYKHGNCQADMACFVSSKEEGELLSKMIPHSILDYRDYEPNRIQLKIGACPSHLVNLQLLGRLTGGAHLICECIINQAINLNNKEKAKKVIDEYWDSILADVMVAKNEGDLVRAENRLQVLLLRTQEAM